MLASEGELINWAVHDATRDVMGTSFVRILGYFREDGPKSITAIEDAMRTKSAAAMVVPAHTLKGEAGQFGADRLAALAEDIEMTARWCIENHETPDDVIEHVVALRSLFQETLTELDRANSPLMRRNTRGFGQRGGLAA